MTQSRPTGFPAERIGERMKRARRAAGLSVEFMAEQFGVSVDTVRSWEQSVHQPRNLLDRLGKWAELTDVSREWLLLGTNGFLFPYPDGLSVVGHSLRLPFKLPPATVDVDLVAIENEERPEPEHEPDHRRAPDVVRAS